LTIEDLRDELNLKYERLGFWNGKGGKAFGDEEEAAFFAGGFKGKCNYCGAYGHKSKNCAKKGGKESKQSSGRNGFKWKCFKCHKEGHKAKDCPEKQKDKGNVAMEGSGSHGESEIAFMLMENEEYAMSGEEKVEKNYFIADSGASCHLVGSDKGMYNCKSINDEVIVGNGKGIQATKIGSLKMLVKQEDGKEHVITLHGVKYVPELGPYNLFSLTTAMKKGYQLGSCDKAITLSKGSFQMAFDTAIITKSSWLAAVEMIPIVNNQERIQPAVSMQEGKCSDVNILHEMFGHIGDDATKFTAEYYKLKCKGELDPCESCARAKARQKNLGHPDDTKKSMIPGERLGFDVSSVKYKSFGGSKYWLLVVDHATDHLWSYFLKKKSDVPETIQKLVSKLVAQNYKVKYLRCDNAGENKMTDELLKKKGIHVEFEYTSPNTPQHNGKVERKFATLYGRIRAMLNAAGLDGNLRQKLWAEAANTATICDGIMVPRRGIKPPYEQFYKQENKCVRNLRRFGEVGIMTKKASIQGKLKDKGVPVMFLGYTIDHSSDTYRVLNLKTNQVVLSRDIYKWLNLSYQQWIRKGNTTKGIDVMDSDSEDEEEEENELAEDDKEEDVDEDKIDGEEEIQSQAYIEQERNLSKTGSCMKRELARIQDYNKAGRQERMEPLQSTVSGVITRAQAKLHNADDKEKEVKDLSNFVQELTGPDMAMIANTVKMMEKRPKVMNEPLEAESKVGNLTKHLLQQLDELKDDLEMSSEEKEKRLRIITSILRAEVPKTFQEAWNHPDPLMRSRWRDAIRKEFHDMIKRGVWRTIKRRDVPADRRLVKSKWVFDVKRDGRFRARLVACGYTQIPGIDFQNSYAPTINDVTWRLLLILMIARKYDAKIVDVETAFLYGELDEEIYMLSPEGLDNKPDECVKLEKAIYGLVQAARQYYKFFVKTLKKVGFEVSKADPCLLMREDEFGTVFFAVWVDDSLVIGDEKAIDKVIKDLKENGLVLKITESLKDYLSCEITFSGDGDKAWIHQPHLIKKLRDKFGEMVEGLRLYKTPGTPGFGIVRNPEGGEKISEMDQGLYRSGTGMLLYLVKYSRPDIANPVRELSKVLDGASPAAFREMLRIIKYVLDTNEMALKIAPNFKKTGVWRVVAFSDSDYAGDTETRHSVSGWAIYFADVLVAWQSKSQRSVTLSSSEAEYVALAEVAKNIKFIYMNLIFMGIDVELPIVVRVDNNGAIFMAENIHVGQRTKHVDICWRFVNEFVEDGFLKVIFVRSEDNDADLFTKNVKGELFEKHSKKMIEKRDPSRLESTGRVSDCVESSRIEGVKGKKINNEIK